MLKAIDTEYKGYLFRSRLEARWAKTFDALGIEWVYEPEGYELPDGTYYLPDFYFPRQQCFIEIKPSEPTQEEVEKAMQLAWGSKKWVDIICGVPGEHKIYGYRVTQQEGVSEAPDRGYQLAPCEFCTNTLFARHSLTNWFGRKEWNWHGHCYDCDAGYIGENPLYLPQMQEAYKIGRSARFEHSDNEQQGTIMHHTWRGK